jgi:hypothetical protein
VRANFEHLLQQEQDNDIGLTLGNLMEPALLAHWRDWKRAMLAEFPGEAGDPRLYAALRGRWLLGHRLWSAAGRSRAPQCAGDGRAGPQAVRPAVTRSPR